MADHRPRRTWSEWLAAALVVGLWAALALLIVRWSGAPDHSAPLEIFPSKKAD